MMVHVNIETFLSLLILIVLLKHLHVLCLKRIYFTDFCCNPQSAHPLPGPNLGLDIFEVEYLCTNCIQKEKVKVNKYHCVLTDQ